MSRFSRLKEVVLAAVSTAAMAATCSAGLVTSFVADGSSFEATPAVNTAGTASGAVNTTFTVSVSLGAGSSSRFGQSFTTVSAFQLDKVELYVGGGVSNNMAIHMYTGFSGGTETDTFINPNNPTPVDLLGGGSGLSFNLNSPAGYLVFDLTGSDEITLAAGTRYYFELSGGDAAMFVRRAGSSPYSGGNAYAGTNPATFRGLPGSGSVRDAAAGFYAAAVPEPTGMSAIGLGLMGVMARRRK
jgi:PEP-CTERM motif